MKMKTTVNLATHIRGLIRLTDENDTPVEADISVQETGFDPVESVHLAVTPSEAKPFTCHILFPEISLAEIPSRVRLGIKINSDDTNVVFDGADKTGPCVALPVYRSGNWVQGSNELDMGKEYMVWKENRTRQLEPPIRIKYLLIISNSGNPIDVEIQGISIES